MAPTPAQFAPWPAWVPADLVAYLQDSGVQQLYVHQERVAKLARQGTHVVVATGTSSGKSLGYLLPPLAELAADPQACALYLTPTKALGSDQLRNILELTRQVPSLNGIAAAPYDGDTPTEARAGIRDNARFIFSNPDMIHASMLANHSRWGRFFRHLKFVIIDECHAYRGMFGAHVALVIRRLRRLAAHYGSDPTFILASATATAPGAHASNLIGSEVAEVTEDGAPTGARTVMLWEPGFIEGLSGENGAPVRRSATSEAAGIMATAIAEGARTLTFVRSRRGAESVALRAAEELALLGRPDFSRRVASYRAGYLAEDRRRLERMLDDGTLLGVATTNALELGIDVGGLDAVVTAGFPGTVASFWQQAGRAGRRGQGSLVVFVARDEPMDTYLVHHPDALLRRPIEQIVFDPTNPYILRGHIYCAAVEKPLSPADVSAWGAEQVVEELTSLGLLRRRPRGWFAADLPDAPITPDTAHDQVNLRGGSGHEVMIVESTTGRLLGTIDTERAPAQVHPGAVYVHQGETYVIESLDLDEYLALAEPKAPEYSTYARSTTDIRIISNPGDSELINPSPGLWVANVDVEVTTQVVGYVAKLADGTILDSVALNMPAQQLTTRAVAYTIDPLALSAMGIAAGDIPGSLHAAEHAAIGMLPLLATCDRWDIGGVSTAEHPDTGLPTVFVYDGHPGGAGFADHGFHRFAEWIEATFLAVTSCPCESGCPSCVQSPKCGNGNNPLDKSGAIKLLSALDTMMKSTTTDQP
ncbi:helicase/secretion neighborhood putative DEAH-box helicase [Corynebacterium epidermidicanis]|uniref:Helicase/secretion neighborhood putative DEAH-box helicase n=2 Tax=Corynebacterium epidermidicanis TaxID=1050174 RepID=A0A0G3GRL8_9CORY|nr:helicase/secretion neighborhood putative DEAH-box helicase [Corynebacterium epidermidicanis]